MFRWGLGRQRYFAVSRSKDADALTQEALIEPYQGDNLRDASEIEAYFFGYFERNGRARSGQDIEILGPRGSGKSNYTTWISIGFLKRGITVFTDYDLFQLSKDMKKKWAKVNRLSDLIRIVVEMRLRGFKDYVIVILDELGKVRGASSETATTKEARFYEELKTRFRKLGIYLFESRQVENIPDDQRGNIAFIVRKSIQRPDIARVENLIYGEKYDFRVPNMKSHYSDQAPASFVLDIDPEEMEKYIDAKRSETTTDMEEMELLRDYIKLNQEKKQFERGEFLEELKEKLGEIKDPRSKAAKKLQFLTNPSPTKMGIKKEDWEQMSDADKDTALVSYLSAKQPEIDELQKQADEWQQIVATRTATHRMANFERNVKMEETVNRLLGVEE